MKSGLPEGGSGPWRTSSSGKLLTEPESWRLKDLLNPSLWQPNLESWQNANYTRFGS
jgi:hypothetical protein